MPGGSIHKNETPEEAAVREVKEEVGLDVEIVPTQETLNLDKDRYTHIITPAYVNSHPITVYDPYPATN